MKAQGKAWSKAAFSKMSEPRKAAVRALAARELVAASGAYLKDVGKEVQDRMVQNVMDEVFTGKPTREKTVD